MDSSSTITDRTRRLTPSLDWVRARRREWQAGRGTGCGTERWRASEEAHPVAMDHHEGSPASRGAPPES
jgi:hypothetical protein